ncbi:MAG: hypothetical protein JWQ27_91 [Ferruginibacter sp.]|nr:hypothetical protein [Ferruginibacter sp.]
MRGHSSQSGVKGCLRLFLRKRNDIRPWYNFNAIRNKHIKHPLEIFLNGARREVEEFVEMPPFSQQQRFPVGMPANARRFFICRQHSPAFPKLYNAKRLSCMCCYRICFSATDDHITTVGKQPVHARFDRFRSFHDIGRVVFTRTVIIQHESFVNFFHDVIFAWRQWQSFKI